MDLGIFSEFGSDYSGSQCWLHQPLWTIDTHFSSVVLQNNKLAKICTKFGILEDISLNWIFELNSNIEQIGILEKPSNIKYNQHRTRSAMCIPACFNRNLDGCLETLTIVTLHFALIDFCFYFCNFPRKGAKSMPWPFVAVEMLAKVQSTLSPCQHWNLTLVHPRYHCKNRLFHYTI